MKKAYIFTLDVFIAILILIIGLMIILGMFFYAPQKERTDALSNDIVSVLANVKLNEVCTTISSAGCDCSYLTLEISDICDEIRKNPDATLVDFIGRTAMSADCGNPALRQEIEDLIKEIFITSSLIPQNFEFQIRVIDSATGNVQQLYPLVP